MWQRLCSVFPWQACCVLSLSSLYFFASGFCVHVLLTGFQWVAKKHDETNRQMRNILSILWFDSFFFARPLVFSVFSFKALAISRLLFHPWHMPRIFYLTATESEKKATKTHFFPFFIRIVDLLENVCELNRNCDFIWISPDKVKWRLLFVAFILCTATAHRLLNIVATIFNRMKWWSTFTYFHLNDTSSRMKWTFSFASFSIVFCLQHTHILDTQCCTSSSNNAK